jgi:hypothetical protein
VNILRKFLLTTEASERAKLVTVLCQILHLQPDESKLISERWAVRSGGLVGWLLPKPPSAPSIAGGNDEGNSNIQKESKKAMESLGFDPWSGGIDLNPY